MLATTSFSSNHCTYHLYSQYFFKGYFVAGKNSNCGAQNVITTELKCQMASTKLGLSYSKQIISYDRPAGCFKDGPDTYLNRIIILESTSPKSDTSGICTRGTVTFVIYFDVFSIYYYSI